MFREVKRHTATIIHQAKNTIKKGAGHFGEFENLPFKQGVIFSKVAKRTQACRERARTLVRTHARRAAPCLASESQGNQAPAVSASPESGNPEEAKEGA
jgi:hypothetical protein